jgi:glycosyltransferase involved in cell wall biosynthesis
MTANEDLLSVVITAHNEEATIRRAILSVTNQSHKNIELLIVNDGSTDSTQNIIEQASNSLDGITILSNERATGLMAARNLGASNASGRFIAFLDGDDEWAPGKAEIQLHELKKLPANSILFTARIIYSIKGIPFIHDKKSTSKRLYTYDYNQVLGKRGTFHLGASMMLERSALEMLEGFDEKAGKERDLIARVGVAGGTIAWLGIPLYIQHRKPNSMSTDTIRTYERELAMLKCWEPTPERHPTREISNQEYQAFRNSILHKYRKQFSLTGVDAPEAGLDSDGSSLLNRLDLRYYKLAKPLHNIAKDSMAFIRYRMYKLTNAEQHPVIKQRR